MAKHKDPHAILEDLRNKQAQKTEEPKEQEQLPARTTIELDYRGTRGKRYQGRFLFAVPNLGDKMSMGAMKGLYLPAGSYDQQAVQLSEMTAYLGTCLIFGEKDGGLPKPDWWDIVNAYDAGPYLELWGRCLDYEAKFHGEGEDAGAVASEDQEQGHRPGSDSAPVGRKIQPPAERPEVLGSDG